MIRSLRNAVGVALLVLSMAAMAGCTAPTVTAPATPASPDPNREAPVSVEPAPHAQAQPYDQLIYLSEAELKERLGEPSEVTTRPKQAAWWYKDLQVRVSLMEGIVYRVDVQAGLITEGLAVGDAEALVQKLTTKMETGKSGIKSYDLKREKIWYRFSVKDDRIMQAVVEMPAFP